MKVISVIFILLFKRDLEINKKNSMFLYFISPEIVLSVAGIGIVEDYSYNYLFEKIFPTRNDLITL